MRVRPGLAVLWRGPGESQVGVDPRCAVVLEGLTSAEQRFVDHLEVDRSERDLLRVARTAGVSRERATAILAALGRSGVLTPGPPVARAVPPEEAYWARLAPEGDGAAVMTRRAGTRVAVAGLDRLGLLLALALAADGVGTVLLDDDGEVTAADVVPYHPRDVGARRGRRALEHLRAAYPHVATSVPAGTQPHLVVAVSHGVADPVLLQSLLRADVPHLAVVVGEVEVSIGPYVLPGQGACTRCVDLHRTDVDPAWPAVATQLRVTTAAGTAAVLAHLGAALAAHQVLAAVDGRPVAARSATLGVSALDPFPVLRQWSAHPACGCAAVDATEPATTAGQAEAAPVAGRTAPVAGRTAPAEAH